MNRILLPAVLLLAIGVPYASAQTVLTYDATVTFASGPDAATFTTGAAVLISYTLADDVADSNADSRLGNYFGAVPDMSVSFPGLGVAVSAGGNGNVQTFNDWDNGGTVSDQVFVFGGPVISSTDLGGVPITSVEVDFLSAFLPAPASPAMIASDALPLFRLDSEEPFIILRTSNGTTFVHVQYDCSNGGCGPVTPACGVDATFAGGTLTLGVTLRTPVAAEWNLSLLAFGAVYPLSKQPLAATDPAITFPLEFPNIPPIGTIGVLSTLTTPGENLTCTATELVNTGAPAAP